MLEAKNCKKGKSNQPVKDLFILLCIYCFYFSSNSELAIRVLVVYLQIKMLMEIAFLNSTDP